MEVYWDVMSRRMEYGCISICYVWEDRILGLLGKSCTHSFLGFPFLFMNSDEYVLINRLGEGYA